MQIDSSVRPTVGRDAELEQLEAALDALAARGSVCVAVEGEPGIGKTRLLAELRAPRRGARLPRPHRARRPSSSATCRSASGSTRSTHTSPRRSWACTRRGTPRRSASSAEVVPSLRPGRRRRATSVADERYRAHRAVRRLLELLAAERPLVLVLDDLHWSDGASIELLGALLRRGPDAPVLLALAFRPGQAPARLSAALAAPVGAADRARAAQRGAGDAAAAASSIRSGGGDLPARRRQPLLPRAARARRRRTATFAAPRGDGRRATAPACPPAVAASLAEELASLSGTRARAARGRGRRRRAVRARSRGGDRRAVARPRGSPRSMRCSSSISCARRRCRAGSSSAIRSCGGRSTSRRRAAGGSPRTRARRPSWLRGARPPAERAHHVEQSAEQGDEEAIELLLEAGAAAAPRAPAVAARWFEATLRLLRASDDERQVDVRVALASALRAVGELERCRATLLEAIELLPPDAAERRVELTALCAAVEHWLGRHEEAHQRLTRAWDDLPDRSTAAAAALQIELAVDGLYELDFEQTAEMGRGALGDRARSGRPRADRGGRVGALPRRDRRRATSTPRASTARRRGPRSTGSRTRSWRRASRRSTTSAGRRPTSSGTTDAIAHFERGIDDRARDRRRAAARPDDARQELRVRDDRAAWPRRSSAARRRSRPRGCRPARTSCTARCSSSAGRSTTPAISTARSPPFEESLRVDRRLAGGTIPNGGGGPGWGLGVAWFDAGEVERGRKILLELGGEDVARTMPVERCFDWESLTLVELAVGNAEAADAYARRAEEDAARLGLQLPAALADRARAAVLLAAGEPAEAARVAARSAEAAPSDRRSAARGVLAQPPGARARRRR